MRKNEKKLLTISYGAQKKVFTCAFVEIRKSKILNRSVEYGID